MLNSRSDSCLLHGAVNLLIRLCGRAQWIAHERHRVVKARGLPVEVVLEVEMALFILHVAEIGTLLTNHLRYERASI